jgi:hypothetical protein
MCLHREVASLSATFLLRFSLLASLAVIGSDSLFAQAAAPQGRVSDDLEAPVRLRPEFQIGLTYRFVTRTEVHLNLPKSGGKDVEIEQQARFDVGIPTGNAGGVLLKARTDRLAVLLRSAGKTVSFDSMKPEDQKTPLGQHLQSSLNRSLMISLDESMRITAVEEKGLAGITPPLAGLPQFGSDELKQLVASLPQGFPADAVRTGDEWTLQGTQAVGEIGEMKFDVTYRHGGILLFEDNSCFEITYQGKLSGDVQLPDEVETNLTGKKMNFEGTSLRGRILYDPLDRMIRLSEQTLTMLLDLPEFPGQKVPLEQIATVRLLRIESTP